VLVQQRAVPIVAADGIRLEARLAEPPDPRGAIVVCHPHPLFEGSMSTPPVPELVRAFGAAGWAALRFNFRGVHRSEGRFGHGRDEQLDVRAAVDLVEELLPVPAPIGVIGVSFGALVGLGAAAGDARITRYVAIGAPVGPAAASADLAIGPPPERLAGWSVRALAIAGGDDPYAPLESLERWRDDTLGDRMRIEIVDGAPHLFAGFRPQLLELVTGFVRA